nr:DUF3768 domain-containing protein [Bradyrhizobium sp. BR 10289]
MLGGGTQVSPKVAAFGLPKLRRLVEQLARYDDFPKRIDPSGEHAFGTFDFEGDTVVFEIVVQPIKARRGQRLNQTPGERVMSVMLGEESALLNGKEARSDSYLISRKAR